MSATNRSAVKTTLIAMLLALALAAGFILKADKASAFSTTIIGVTFTSGCDGEQATLTIVNNTISASVRGIPGYEYIPFSSGDSTIVNVPAGSFQAQVTTEGGDEGYGEIVVESCQAATTTTVAPTTSTSPQASTTVTTVTAPSTTSSLGGPPTTVSTTTSTTTAAVTVTKPVKVVPSSGQPPVVAGRPADGGSNTDANSSGGSKSGSGKGGSSGSGSTASGNRPAVAASTP